MNKKRSINLLSDQLGIISTSSDFDWIITENLLKYLDPELRQAAIAVSIPHWFNPEIIKALCPELDKKSDILYQGLLNLPFVKPFGKRGCNIHELTRSQILNWLWENERNEFILLSKRAAEYFHNRNRYPEISEFVQETEYYYHLAIDSTQTRDIQSIFQDLYSNSQFEKLDFLTHSLFELTQTNRLPEKTKFYICFWKDEIVEHINQKNKVICEENRFINCQNLKEKAKEEPSQIHKIMFN